MNSNFRFMLPICTGLAFTVLATALTGCGGGAADSTSEQPPVLSRPPSNAVTETMVQGSGQKQTSSSGTIENSPIIGEMFLAGFESNAGSTSIRCGFTPPSSSNSLMIESQTADLSPIISNN